MAALKEKLGRIPCEGCGHPTIVKRNEAHTLTMACDECDASSFAKKGTTAARRWLSKLPAAPAADVPAPAPKPAAPVLAPRPQAAQPAAPVGTPPVGTLPVGKPPKATGFNLGL